MRVCVSHNTHNKKRANTHTPLFFLFCTPHTQHCPLKEILIIIIIKGNITAAVLESALPLGPLWWPVWDVCVCVCVVVVSSHHKKRGGLFWDLGWLPPPPTRKRNNFLIHIAVKL